MAERLTVLIPCKDEALNIGACIESVRAVADEILVADSGSSDAVCVVNRSWPESLEPECFDAEAAATIMPMELPP